MAGLGDLIATCASTLSRNHYVGYKLAEGYSLAKISATMPQVAEGVTTTMAVHQLNKKLGIKAPLTELVYRILFEGLPPAEMAASLMKLIER